MVADFEITATFASFPQRLTDLRRNLEATLGAELYTAAWERGAKLELNTVVDQLLAELADE